MGGLEDREAAGEEWQWQQVGVEELVSVVKAIGGRSGGGQCVGRLGGVVTVVGRRKVAAG